jgi:hypothetical protein
MPPRSPGFHTWLRLDRHVRKGEKGILILAPVVRRVRVEDDSGDQQIIVGSPSAFRAAYVFDIAQTDGEDLPEIAHRPGGDDPGNAFARLLPVAASLGFTVEHSDDFSDARNGDCDHRQWRIRIRDGLTSAQRVKTLAHELAHAILHGDGFDGTRELEAESVAYIVCGGLELDSSEYSFGYVASWAGGGPEAVKAISASGQRIVKARARSLDGGFVAEEAA